MIVVAAVLKLPTSWTDFTHSDEFTPQQIKRMRQTLYNSYTTPGIKIVNLKSINQSDIDRPVMVEGMPRAIACHPIQVNLP